MQIKAIHIGCLWLGGLVLGLGTAQAGSDSVTIYGTIDTGITWLSNAQGNSGFHMSDSISQGNRFGLRGQEDLGDGLSAVFTLEGGFNSTTGESRQGGLLFGRQALVGLSHKHWGMLTLGRRTDLMSPTLLPFQTGFYTGIYSVNPGDADRISGQQLDSLATYSSPTWSGFKFNLQYRHSDDRAAQGSRGRVLGASFNYEQGALRLGAAMTQIKKHVYRPGAYGLAQIFGVDLTAAPQTSFVLDDYRTIGAAAGYTIAGVNLNLLYTNTRFKLDGWKAQTMHSAGLAANYRITPQLLLAAGYTYSRQEDARWNTYSLIFDYFLSKRTDVYASANYRQASGPGVKAGMSTVPVSSDNGQLALRVGIRHKF